MRQSQLNTTRFRSTFTSSDISERSSSQVINTTPAAQCAPNPEVNKLNHGVNEQGIFELVKMSND